MSDPFHPAAIEANIKASEDAYDCWYEKTSGFKTSRAKLQDETDRLRTALAEQARLNGMGSEREAEAYRRGVEDAAKVADRFWNSAVVPEARGESDTGAAIRSLTAPDKEGA